MHELNIIVRKKKRDAEHLEEFFSTTPSEFFKTKSLCFIVDVVQLLKNKVQRRRLKDDDLLDAEEDIGDSAEAIMELREAQENVQNEEQRKWEDGLLDGTNGGRELVESVKDMVFGREEDKILYEDRVFCFSSFNSIVSLKNIESNKEVRSLY
ncbi:chloroplast envelope membrane protein [Tanacetum coccineum]|uniref:Chloroplast envelope membrane protein n=1 Tax=Tanacetum coccineum TaxID=301880 RepID=A0ABQ5CMT2_9ASTR